jgi:putative tricarboxylic transport membrane protein
VGVDAAQVLAALTGGLQQLLHWPTPFYLIAGVAIGFVVGVLPGLGGPAALALMLPAVIPLAPLDGFVLLTAAAAVSTAAGDITSIVLGVPGEATAAAIVPDGHAMARRGEAGLATGAAITASTLGAVIGVALLVVFIPVTQPLLAQIQSPELTALALLGIGLLVPLSRAHPVKGLLSGALGLSLATVGLDPSLGEPRFTLGQLTLWDGLGLLPVALGIYAVPEALQILAAASPTSGSTVARSRRVGHGCREALNHLGLITRCSLIGAAIGALPGVGASISQWMAYAHAAQRSKHRHLFGTGQIEGVVGPAAATTATLGGALMPTLALGIPGSVTTSFLLGALILKGITPGPATLLPEQSGGHLTLVFSLVWCVVLASVAGAGLGIASLNSIARVATIRPGRLFPIVLTLVMIGTVGERHVVADLAIVVVLGVVGHALAAQGWPRAPFVLGFVLGPLLERRFLLAQTVYGWSWLVRPGVVALGVLAAAAAIAAMRAQPGNQRAHPVSPASRRGDLALTLGFAAVAATALFFSLELGPRSAFFPRLVFGITLVLSLWQFVIALRKDYAVAAVRDNPIEIGRVPTIVWLLIFAFNAWLLGLVLGTCTSTALFSRLRAGESWRATAVTTIIVGLLAYVLIVHVLQTTDDGRLLQMLR